MRIPVLSLLAVLGLGAAEDLAPPPEPVASKPAATGPAAPAAAEAELEIGLRFMRVQGDPPRGPRAVILVSRVAESDPIDVFKVGAELLVQASLDQIERFKLVPGTSHKVLIAVDGQGNIRLAEYLAQIQVEAVEIKAATKAEEARLAAQQKDRQKDVKFQEAMAAMLGSALGEDRKLPKPTLDLSRPNELGPLPAAGQYLASGAKPPPRTRKPVEPRPADPPEQAAEVPAQAPPPSVRPLALGLGTQLVRLQMIDDGPTQLVGYQGQLRKGQVRMTGGPAITIEVLACDGRFAVVKGLSGIAIGQEVDAVQSGSGF